MHIRLNKFIAANTGLSRRSADEKISKGEVLVNGRQANLGQNISSSDKVTLNNKAVLPKNKVTIIFNNPVGYVCSKNGQGNSTIYELLPKEFADLKTVGRLDKDSSGLLLLTNDGDLANSLTHPKFQKNKEYIIDIDKPLQPLNQQMISDMGVMLDDGPSKLILESMNHDRTKWRVVMSEGRNRQIRRTFKVLDYVVTSLHRTKFGSYELGDINSGAYQSVTTEV